MKIIIELPCPVEIVSGDDPETLIIRPKPAELVTVAKVNVKKSKSSRVGIPAPAEPVTDAVSKKSVPQPEKLKGIVMGDEGWE